MNYDRGKKGKKWDKVLWNQDAFRCSRYTSHMNELLDSFRILKMRASSINCVRNALAYFAIAAISSFASIDIAAAEDVPATNNSGAGVRLRQSRGPNSNAEDASVLSSPLPSSSEEILAKTAELTAHLAKFPNDVAALIARSRLYFLLKDHEKGNSDLTSALRIAPENADAWHLYGQQRLARGLTQEAIEAFEKAIDLGSKNPLLFLNLGYAYHTVAKRQEAIANYTRAIQYKPDYGEAYIGRAFVWSDTEDWDKAIAELNRAIEVGYRKSWVFFERGRAYQMLGDDEQAITSYTLAIQHNPDHAKSHFGRAHLRLRTGDVKNAIADFDRAIEIEPGSAFYRSARGIAYFDQGNFNRGTADVLEAIRLNSGDVGANYQFTTNKELSPEALKHGEEQLRNMLRDRPAMAQFVSPQDKIWQWAVRKFAGEDLGASIDWDPTPPGNVSAASFRPGSKHARIQVSETRVDLPDRRQCTFDELWQSAVFELHNITSSSIWADLDQQVIDGTLEREDYIVAMLDSEELAAQCTRAFYLKFYLPWIRAKGMVDTSPRDWYCENFFSDRQSRLAEWRKTSHWQLYATQFDYFLGQRAYWQSNYEEALKLLQAVVAKDNLLEKEYVLDARYLLGQSYEATNRLEQAINEYSAILDVDPNDSNTILARAIARSKAGLAAAALEDFERFLKVEGSTASAYYRRGVARADQGQSDVAMADFDEAIRLNPKLVAALSARASEHFRRGAHEAALKDLTTAIEIEPENAELYLKRGSAWADKKEFARAVADFDKAIQLAPLDSRGFIGRANAWYDQGELNKSLSDWNAVVRLLPDNSWAYFHRGTVYLDSKQYKQAFADLSKAIELAPELPDAYATRAELLLASDDPECKRPDAALKDAQRSCELTQWQSSDHLALLASAYASGKDYKSAVEWQTKALLLSEPADRPGHIKVLEAYKTQKVRLEKEESAKIKDDSKKNWLETKGVETKGDILHFLARSLAKTATRQKYTYMLSWMFAA